MSQRHWGAMARRGDRGDGVAEEGAQAVDAVAEKHAVGAEADAGQGGPDFDLTGSGVMLVAGNVDHAPAHARPPGTLPAGGDDVARDRAAPIDLVDYGDVGDRVARWRARRRPRRSPDRWPVPRALRWAVHWR